LEYDDDENIRLLEGKMKREELKKALKAHLYAESMNKGGRE